MNSKNRQRSATRRAMPSLQGLVLCVLCILPCAAQRLTPDEVKAHDYGLAGARIGMSQRQLLEQLPLAHRMDSIVGGLTGRFITERGQERWELAPGPGNVIEAHFEFIDSSMYAMSWALDQKTTSFRKLVKKVVGQIGHAKWREKRSQTWRFDAISRQIVVVHKPNLGVRVGVIDFRRVAKTVAARDSLERQERERAQEQEAVERKFEMRYQGLERDTTAEPVVYDPTEEDTSDTSVKARERRGWLSRGWGADALKPVYVDSQFLKHRREREARGLTDSITAEDARRELQEKHARPDSDRLRKVGVMKRKPYSSRARADSVAEEEKRDKREEETAEPLDPTLKKFLEEQGW